MRSIVTVSIRVDAPEGWRYVSLYEFHPSYDDRLKFRSYAYIELQRDLLRLGDGRFRVIGEGRLDEPYMEVNETGIHEQDVRDLMHYCAEYNDGDPLIIQPCPRPEPHSPTPGMS